jgi:hypothetical protein
MCQHPNAGADRDGERKHRWSCENHKTSEKFHEVVIGMINVIYKISARK